MSGSELAEQIPELKRTTIYAILDRLQEERWIEQNPGPRPIKYRANSPQIVLNTKIEEIRSHLSEMQELNEYIRSLEPILQKKSYFPIRITSTYVIPDISDLASQLTAVLHSAHNRILLYVSYSLVESIQSPLSEALQRIMRTWTPNGIESRFEYFRDNFTFIVFGDAIPPSFKSPFERLLQKRCVFLSGKLTNEIIVIDDIAFLPTEMGLGLGLAIRVEDPTVASTYATLLAYHYTNFRVQQVATRDEELIRNRLPAIYSDLWVQLQRLLSQGWLFYPDHTSNDYFELGLISPGGESAYYREAGFRYIPKEKIDSLNMTLAQALQLNFEDYCERRKYYLKQLERKIEYQDAQTIQELYGISCLTLNAAFSAVPEWDKLLKSSHLTFPLVLNQPAPQIIGFIWQEKAVILIWAINPKNSLEIMHALVEPLPVKTQIPVDLNSATHDIH